MGFFDSFLGKSQQRDLSAANKRAEEYMSSGLANARTEMAGGRDRALNHLTPYMQRGETGSRMYSDALGLNGNDARTSAYGTYSSSPFLEAQRGAGDNALTRMFQKYNAQGMGNSGMSRLAVSRAAGEREAGNQSDWMNRLAGLGQQGGQFAGTAAGIEQGTGQYLADLESGYGQQRAGNAINYGNALAQSRSTGINNLLRVGGILGGMAMGGGGRAGGGQIPSWGARTTTTFG